MEGLIILYGLFVKHAIADLAMQSFRKTPGDKSNLRSPKGYIHAADHAGLTFIVIALLTNNVVMSILIALLDYVLHFVIDYIKTKIIKKCKWTTDQTVYWIAQSVDQTAHYTCYLIYVLLLTSI
jgi:hypothetical protein